MNIIPGKQLRWKPEHVWSHSACNWNVFWLTDVIFSLKLGVLVAVLSIVLPVMAVDRRLMFWAPSGEFVPCMHMFRVENCVSYYAVDCMMLFQLNSSFILDA